MNTYTSFSSIYYPPIFIFLKMVINFQLRKNIIELYNNQCADCGMEFILKNKKLRNIHHIDGNRKNNQLDNLKLVCFWCHTYNYHQYKENKMLEWAHKKGLLEE